MERNTKSGINIYFLSLEHVFVGPDKWGDEYPVANGPRQSPINIVPNEAQYDSSLKALKLRYDPSNSKGILNNGHSFQVDFVDDTDSSSKHVFLIQKQILIEYNFIFLIFISMTFSKVYLAVLFMPPPCCIHWL